MIVAIDTTVLLLLLRPDAGVPIDPTTGAPISNAPGRIALLVEELERQKAQIVIPTPALSELLVRAGNAGPEILERLQKWSVFRIAPFGTLAAVEVAMRTKAAIDAGDKRGGQTGEWAKIKYDRQIVAVASVERATTIYSDDDGVRAFATAQGLRVISVRELPLPPIDPQGDLLDALTLGGSLTNLGATENGENGPSVDRSDC